MNDLDLFILRASSTTLVVVGAVNVALPVFPVVSQVVGVLQIGTGVGGFILADQIEKETKEIRKRYPQYGTKSNWW